MDLQTMCRVCLSENINDIEAKSLFATIDDSDISLADFLMKFINFEISPNDGLPGKICYNCYKNIKIAINVKILCEQSNIKLKEFCTDKNQLETESELVFNLKDKNDIFEEVASVLEITSSNEEEDGVSLQHVVFVDHVEKEQSSINTILNYEESSEISTEKQEIFKKPKRKRAISKCDQCGRDFKCNAQLIQHLRIHTGERPFGCDVCEKRFSQRGNLETHMRKHSKEKPYICEICSKQFATSGNLQQHSICHSIERNFICQICSAAFRTEKELKSHAGIHTGIKNAICGICGKAFYKTNYLTLHMRTVHCGLKLFKCTKCYKTFSNSSNLKAHFRIHTGEKPFHCDSCPVRFNQSSSLARHRKQHERNTVAKNNVEKVQS